MNFIWYAAAFATGLGLGVCFGILLRAIIANWESAATAYKVFIGVMLALFGGGAFGATALFGRLVEGDNTAFYFLGLGIGLVVGVVGLFFPARPFTLKGIKGVIEMSDSLREKIANVDDRASFIASQLVPPKSIEREAKISEE